MAKKFLIVRDHLEYKEGDSPSGLTDDQKNYLVAMGVAKYGETDSPSLKQKEELEEEALQEKEQRQAAAEKQSKAGPNAPKKKGK